LKGEFADCEYCEKKNKKKMKEITVGPTVSILGAEIEHSSQNRRDSGVHIHTSGC
jgi:hypothetical protein